VHEVMPYNYLSSGKNCPSKTAGMTGKKHKPATKSGSKTKNYFNVWKLLIAVLLVMAAANAYLALMITGNPVPAGTATETSTQTNIRTENAQNQQAPAQQTSPQKQYQQQAVQVSADDDPVKGDANAPVTMIEFGDFECPFCEKFYSQILPRLEEEYIIAGKLRLIFRDFPLNSHQQARPAAEAAECAKEQGKFWEFHDKIFENQQSLSEESYRQWATDIGLNTAQFSDCFDSGKYRSEVEKDFADGSAAGVRGTSIFFINGVKLVGAQPYSVFRQVIDQQLETIKINNEVV